MVLGLVRTHQGRETLPLGVALTPSLWQAGRPWQAARDLLSDAPSSDQKPPPRPPPLPTVSTSDVVESTLHTPGKPGSANPSPSPPPPPFPSALLEGHSGPTTATWPKPLSRLFPNVGSPRQQGTCSHLRSEGRGIYCQHLVDELWSDAPPRAPYVGGRCPPPPPSHTSRPSSPKMVRHRQVWTW